MQRQDSAVTQKAAGANLQNDGGDDHEPSVPSREEIDRINAKRVGTAGTVVTQGGLSNNAANETKDAITGRIIHTVNMMKERRPSGANWIGVRSAGTRFNYGGEDTIGYKYCNFSHS